MAKKIQDLRDTLFMAIQNVQDDKLSVDKAKVIVDLAQVIVNSAKAEVDFLKNVNQQGNTGFISPENKQLKNLP